MSKWKLIDSAPKTGRRIILFAQGSHGINDTYWAVSYWFDHTKPGTLANESGWIDWPYAIKPTHWQPLPVPPAS